ncbi:MAG: hypothetical protein AAGA95_05995 [Pseudomonadota bacterium]
MNYNEAARKVFLSWRRTCSPSRSATFQSDARNAIFECFDLGIRAEELSEAFRRASIDGHPLSADLGAFVRKEFL